VEAECRYCECLSPYRDAAAYLKDENGMPTWRCPFGRFDKQAPGGKPIKCWYAWSVIWTPNEAVAKAQEGCIQFDVHTQAKTFTEKGRVL